MQKIAKNKLLRKEVKITTGFENELIFKTV